MLLSDLTENQQPFLDSILKEDADVFGMYCWAIKNDKKLVEDWEMIRAEYNKVTGINLTEKQLHEVNWKKLAATAAMIGTLLTPGMAQAYGEGDLRRMGFDNTEIAQLADMPAQDKADTINAQIDKIGGGKSGGGGYYYDFPKVDATTVDTQRPNIRTGVDPKNPDKVDSPEKNKWGQDAGGNAQGTGDPETLQKNTELLRTVINADHRVAGKIKQIYYSGQANKIVIIPNYKDFARMGTNKIDSKLGGSIVDSIAHALIVPIVRTAIHNLGVPNLDMNNVIIVDRGARAPR